MLARFLLEQGYEVHGLRLYSATNDTCRIDDILDSKAFFLHYGDLMDGGSLHRLIAMVQPDEIYNLAAQSHVKVSFDVPEATAQINALGTLRLLEAIRGTGIRFYQASSSELFGRSPAPQNETTPFAPCSPYACAKLYAYWLVRNYREAYGLFAVNGILFNHESPLRGEEFVTRKISLAVAAIIAGKLDCLKIGNLDARRDWGHARDYVTGMWMMLQQQTPDDYVLATGRAHSVRDFLEAAFACAGMRLAWRGSGVDEKGYNAADGRLLVAVDPQFFRPNEVHELLGDASKARTRLGWKPRISFRDLVAEMVTADMAALQGGQDYEQILLAAE